MKDRYDYIIVGAGSAGCALANRLSADPANSVLLVESGPIDDSMFIHMPRGIGVLSNPGSKYIWDYQVETGGNGPSERWFRGKTLGGSSSINGMIYMRGAPLDYDGWAKLGCTGWSWRDVLPKFVEMEGHDLGDAEHRGGAGELKIQTHPKGEPLFEALIEAGEEMGISRVADVNAPDAVEAGGIGYQTTTRHGNARMSSARAFLNPVKGRPNLDIATETDALRIVFEGRRAAGMMLRHKGETKRVAATREIVVATGAIQTPKLLQLSGIGPKELLAPLGIDVVSTHPRSAATCASIATSISSSRSAAAARTRTWAACARSGLSSSTSCSARGRWRMPRTRSARSPSPSRGCPTPTSSSG